MKRRDTIWALVFAMTICVIGVRAQEQQQNSPSTPVSPIPPLNSGGGDGYSKPPLAAARGVSAPYDPASYDPSQVEPDTSTLSGAQLFGVGSLEHAHNIFDPAISFSELGQTSPGAVGQTGLGSETMLNALLNFNRTWSRYRLTATYFGGETFYQGPISLNQQFHDLAASQEIDWERWRLILRDDFTASPGAAFAGTGMGGPGLIAEQSASLGSALSGLGQLFIPSESIETGNAMRYRNSALAQVEYSFSRRSAFTFSGSYGLLHFTDAGYISSQMVNAQAGYDYLLDPKNSIAVLAGYGKINYTGTSGSTTEYMAGLAYGRKITGRLAFQLGAGPQQIRSSSGTGTFQFWFPSINSALTYERRRSGVSLSYTRGLTAGSGVFVGAKSNTFSGAAHYSFTRFWVGAVTGGYAMNAGLIPAGGTSTSFENWFAGVNFGRQVGPHARINFNYGVEKQNNSNVCPVTSCGVNSLQQTAGMTVNWHMRPGG